MSYFYHPHPQQFHPSSGDAAATASAAPAPDADALDYDEPVLLSKLRAQVEFYFSEENLSRDVFLQTLLNSRDHPGAVPVATIASFPRIREIYHTFHRGHQYSRSASAYPADPVAVGRSLRGSRTVAVSQDGHWLRPVVDSLPSTGPKPVPAGQHQHYRNNRMVLPTPPPSKGASGGRQGSSSPTLSLTDTAQTKATSASSSSPTTPSVSPTSFDSVGGGGGGGGATSLQHTLEELQDQRHRQPAVPTTVSAVVATMTTTVTPRRSNQHHQPGQSNSPSQQQILEAQQYNHEQHQAKQPTGQQQQPFASSHPPHQFLVPAFAGYPSSPHPTVPEATVAPAHHHATGSGFGYPAIPPQQQHHYPHHPGHFLPPPPQHRYPSPSQTLAQPPGAGSPASSPPQQPQQLGYVAHYLWPSASAAYPHHHHGATVQLVPPQGFVAAAAAVVAPQQSVTSSSHVVHHGVAVAHPPPTAAAPSSLPPIMPDEYYYPYYYHQYYPNHPYHPGSVAAPMGHPAELVVPAATMMMPEYDPSGYFHQQNDEDDSSAVSSAHSLPSAAVVATHHSLPDSSQQSQPPELYRSGWSHGNNNTKKKNRQQQARHDIKYQNPRYPAHCPSSLNREGGGESVTSVTSRSTSLAEDEVNDPPIGPTAARGDAAVRATAATKDPGAITVVDNNNASKSKDGGGEGHRLPQKARWKDRVRARGADPVAAASSVKRRSRGGTTTTATAKGGSGANRDCAAKGSAKSKAGDGATILSDENFPALGGGGSVEKTAVTGPTADRGRDPSRRPVAPLPYADAVKTKPKGQSTKPKKLLETTDGADAAAVATEVVASTFLDDVAREMLGLSVDD